MFKKSLIISVSALMLASSLSTGILNVKAYTDKESENIESTSISEEFSNENQIFMENGTKNELSTQETDDSIIITIENEEGKMVFTRKKDESHIYVNSNYLSDDEIKNLEEETNNVQIDSDDVYSKSLRQTDTNQLQPMQQTGKWLWSNWTNHTVTTAGKTTVVAITAALVSYIPKIGPLASAFATIILENSINTGYFRTSQGSRLDTSPNYVWRRSRVRLYKDAARTNLISYKISTPQRIWVSH